LEVEPPSPVVEEWNVQIGEAFPGGLIFRASQAL
jgi:hypothetical protein